MRPVNLLALEAGEYSALPGGVFRKGSSAGQGTIVVAVASYELYEKRWLSLKRLFAYEKRERDDLFGCLPHCRHTARQRDALSWVQEMHLPTKALRPGSSGTASRSSLSP
jgi:hypothetical protein